MSTKRITTNRAVYIVIVLLVVIVAFLLLGGGPWAKGMMNEGGSVNMANWNWTQILIGTGIGFLLGIVVGSRKW
jgi:hypothetical protein